MLRNQTAKQNGFTLVEVMVVVVIVAILASIATASYDYVIRKKNRSAAQQFMLEIASAQERYILDARQYTDIPGLGIPIPLDVSRYYTVTATPFNNRQPPYYLIQAVADQPGIQIGQPTVSLDSTGQKTNWK